MKKYDLHTHTKYSLCSNLEPSLLLKLAVKKGLDGIAVTDHNSIKGALTARKLNKNKDFEVIIGSEIKTDKGEVLALYIDEEIRPGDFEDVIDSIKKQGGLAAIAHPFTIGLLRKRAKLDFDKIKNKIDAIETFNSRMIFDFLNKKAQTVAEKFNIAQTAGSDSHFRWEIARAFTIFDGDLRKALKNRKTEVQGSNSLSLLYRSFSFFEKYLIRKLF
jgi:hypothetical protein